MNPTAHLRGSLVTAALIAVGLAPRAAAQAIRCPDPVEARPVPPLGDSTAIPLESLSVLTQHNDLARTGAYLQERVLNEGTVCPGRFGKLFSRWVDGQIYAQPLYVAGVHLPDGRVRNVVFVATMHNSLYAFDADDPSARQAYWSVTFGNSVPYDFIGMPGAIFGRNINPEIGITSTPVIDYTSGTIYLTAKTCDRAISDDCRHSHGDGINYRLHALDIATGQERPNSPRLISASCIDSTGAPPYRVIQFSAAYSLQRAALLLVNQKVYLGFGSHADAKPYHGWLLSYSADSLARVNTFCPAPHVDGGAIWQAGSGPAADEAGNVYVMTGNAEKGEHPVARDKVNRVIRLTPDLVLHDWFTPANAECLSEVDVDLGSAGPLLLPGTRLLLAAGKEGVAYLMSIDSMGKRQSANSLARHDQAPCARAGSQPFVPPMQSFQAAREWELSGESMFLPVTGYHHIHGSPVFYTNPYNGPEVFIWPEHDQLHAYRFSRTHQRFPDTSAPGWQVRDSYHTRGESPHGMPGGILSLSADGRERTAGWPANHYPTGIVWAALPSDDDAFVKTVSGVLRAYRASDLSLLWQSSDREQDATGRFAKYTPPTIANGRVYLATFSNRLEVYGVLPQ